VRAAILAVIACVTLALASPPTLAQPYPNPRLLQASWVNLNKVVIALGSYFTDFGRYPQIIEEIVGIGGRQYIVELPVDPCTGAPFGAPTGYGYVPWGNPATSYILRTNWSQARYGAECLVANNYMNIQYIPGRGVQLTP